MIRQERRWLPQARRATFEVYRQQAVSAWIEARGDSMRPLIRPGAQLLVEFGATPAGIGEIALFSLRDLVVAHRVVARRGTGALVAKGDAEPYCDPPLDPADVLGLVRAVRHGHDEPSGVGCAGRLARMIARISWWSGRGAALARRTAALLPAPLRRMVLRAIPPLARVAAQVLIAPFSWTAGIQALFSYSSERG